MRKSCFFAQISGGYGANCTDGWQGRSCLAKRMECVELAPAVGCVARFESGSKLHALHTLRAVWFRLSRPGDRRALPALPISRSSFPGRFGQALGLPRSDPFLHSSLQNVQRHRPVSEYLIVKLPDIKTVAQFFGSERPQLF